MSTTTRFLAAAAAAGLVAIAATATGAAADPSRAPSLPEAFVNGQAAVERAGSRLPEIAARYGLNPGELQRMLLGDPTLGLDRSRRLAYFDEPEPVDADHDAENAAGGPTTAFAVADIPLTDAFTLSSLPGADKTIHLDFDGHVTTGTTWNSSSGRTSITSPAYDRDGDPSTFSDAERRIVIDTWAVVAEDFAPWNVNVTTIDPGTDDLRRSGSGDTRWGVRVVVTGDDWNNCGCGGFAYLGSFDDTADEPVFVFNSSFVGVSEAASHEVGHALLLNHDGLSSGTTYYRGHDTTGTPGWAPIMGASYYEPVTQWSKQEYAGADNTGQDDLAIIGSLTNGNAFGLRADDHGDDAASATPLSTRQVSEVGVIETRDDVDVFVFTTTGGDVTFSAVGADVGPNLDIRLTLRDASGAVVAEGNVVDGLDAGLSATVGAGTFTVGVEGVGVGNPFVSPPSGYTDYASIGQYRLTGDITGVDTPAPDTTPPSAPAGLIAAHADGAVTVTWDPNTEPDLAGYVIARSTSPTGPFDDIGTVDAPTATLVDTPPAGVHSYVVRAFDLAGNVSGDSAATSVEVPEPPVDLTRTATGETPVAGTVIGTFAATRSRDGVGQTITEVDSGGKPSRRHDLAEHQWTIPASLGNQVLRVAATVTGGGDEDTGFAIEMSTQGGTWIPVAFVPNGTTTDVTADIGAPAGDVTVRVVDTDRRRGNTSHNSITIDLLEITGDGETVEPPTASMVVADLTTSTQGAGRGQHVGVATVTVSDELGNPVGGASVSVTFSGDFDETVVGTTNSTGVASLTTASAAKRPQFAACVASITAAALPYLPGTEGC